MMTSHSTMRIKRPNTTLRELALEKMRQAILELHFKPGERLVERKLCDELGVSRTVVREVLRHLEADGLVQTLPNKGPIVAITTADEARQIYEIRAILEATAARACALENNKANSKKLQQIMDHIRLAYSEKNYDHVLSNTNAFYDTLFRASHREIALGIVNSLKIRINHLRSLTIKSPQRDIEGPKQMQKIVDAISAGNGEEAYEATLAHIKRASEIAKTILDKDETVS
ncbi:GntR family transcriptional regulator [Bartonella apihabitans]|uniref:GntR family transcriptional regulator n=2 Tax=Bartonella TaxID=773 RepID=UPI0035572B85